MYPDVESFLEYLDSDYVSTAKMQYGTAVDAIIENPDKYWNARTREYIYDGIVVPEEYISKITPFFDYNFPFQVSGKTEFKIGDTTVILSARADQLHGLDTVEFKTVWNGYSYEKYDKSVQWKCYNLIYDTPRVRYVVADSKVNSGGDIKLKSVYQFYLYRESTHYLEISSLLSQLVDFLITHNRIEKMEKAV